MYAGGLPKPFQKLRRPAAWCPARAWQIIPNRSPCSCPSSPPHCAQASPKFPNSTTNSQHHPFLFLYLSCC